MLNWDMKGLDNGCKGVHQVGKGDNNLTSYDFSSF